MERIVAVYLGVIHVGFGLIILVGGAVRFPPPTYQPLLDATHGHVWPYGTVYLASGILLILAQGVAIRVAGAILGVVANSCFSALFLVAVFMFPDAGATAWWAYLALASQSAALATLAWLHRTPGQGRKPRRREG